MTATAAERLDRYVELIKAGCPPYTGAWPTYKKCGHPRSPDNTYRYTRNGKPYSRCRECAFSRPRRRRAPVLCDSCQEPLGTGHSVDGYHPGPCEPTTCTCPDGGHPDGLGERGSCHRLVLWSAPMTLGLHCPLADSIGVVSFYGILQSHQAGP